MLQRAAAAMAEMRARRSGAIFARVQPFDDPAFASAAAAGPEPRAHAVARHREGQKHRLATVFGDTVAPPAEPLDTKLDDLVGASLAPATRARHHVLLWSLCGALARDQVSG